MSFLDSREDITLARAMLREELQAESNSKAAALNDGAQDEAHAASKRELAIYDILTALEAIAATAGIPTRGHAADAG